MAERMAGGAAADVRLGAIGVVGLVSAAACAQPAWRAGRIDPSTVPRTE